MEILLVITSIDITHGGPSRSAPALARGLAELGHSVTLLTVASERMNTAALEGSGVKLIALDEKATNAEIEKVFDEGHFELVHAQSIWEMLYRRVQRIARKRGIPYISTPRGSLEPWALSFHSWKKMLALLLYQKRDLRRSSAVLATSKMEAEHIREVTGIDAAVIPNGLDVSEFPCRGTETMASGAAVEAPKIKQQVLFLSRIHPVKGLEMLIEAWATIHENHPDWNLVIAGNGDLLYVEEIHGLISRMGLARCIKLLPPRFGEDKIRLFHESALLVLPSFNENFGMVVAEAMACGLPVITTTATPWEVLNERGLGWCVEPTADNLVSSLETAISCGLDGLASMGQHASQYVRDTFDYRKVAAQMVLLYEKVKA